MTVVVGVVVVIGVASVLSGVAYFSLCLMIVCELCSFSSFLGDVLAGRRAISRN
jgi:hypothetical protein